MAVSCFTVLWSIISKPRAENILWIYILRPIFWVLLVASLAAATYLYLVPFTNVVGMGLFADYTCPATTGVWQVCGRLAVAGRFDPNGTVVIVGFFVFLIILSTIGMYIFGIICYIFSRRKGYVKRFTWGNFCDAYCCCESANYIDEWVQTDTVHQEYECLECCGSGPYLYFTSTIMFAIATFMSTIIVGIWFGRYIAVNTNTYCSQYQNTKIGLYGCVSNVNQQYVGGQDCMNCAGLGFAILGIPLLIAELLAISMFICLKKCRVMYREAKNRLVAEQETANANAQANKECIICLTPLEVFAVLPCHKSHIICSSCSNKVDKCPVCRKEFNKKDVMLHKKEVNL